MSYAAVLDLYDGRRQQVSIPRKYASVYVVSVPIRMFTARHLVLAAGIVHAANNCLGKEALEAFW
jgi:hypothetical protein